MEIIERPNMTAVKFLNSIKYETFKTDCINDAEVNGDKKPTDKDMKTWFSILKQFCKTNLKTKGVTKRIYSYSQSTPAGLGGRLFCGGSMQGIWGVYRGLLMRGIGTDIDMKNCHPVLLRYICHRHDIRCPELEYYINHRDECLAEFPTAKVGKTTYLVATNSNKKQWRPFRLPNAFKKYDAEMKKIQKQLVELPDYKNLQETIPEYKLSKNYDGSVTNRILCYYENIVLQHALHVLNRKGMEVAIFMFDGLMCYGDYYNDENLLKEITDYVEEQMPNLNMKWDYKEHDDTLKIDDNFDPNTVSNEDYRPVADDNEAAKLIFEELKVNLIYTKNRMFMKLKNVWIEDRGSIDDYVIKHILSSNITRRNDDDKYIPYSQNLKSAMNVRDVLYILIRTQDETFDIYDKFHTTTKNRLCFKDGVLDFKEKKFYKWDEVNFEIYSTVLIHRNFHEYFNNPNIAVVNEIKDRIFEPLFSRDTTKALNFLSRGLAGHYEDKNWATYLGNRDCGKGVFYDGIEMAFEDYVKTFELGNITYERNTDTNETARKLYWLMDYEFVRLGISQETPSPDENLKVRGKLLKKLAGGGDTHIARRNYDRVDTHFKIDTTFMFMGNNEVVVDDKDAYEHHIPFHSVNQFKSQDEINQMRNRGESELVLQSFKIKDPTIKEKCLTEEWKNAFVYLVYQYYIDNAVSIEKEETEDEEALSTRKSILLKFLITNNKRDYILCSNVESLLNISKKKIKHELESMGVKKVKSNFRDSTKDKNIYIGMQRLEETIYTDDEDGDY